MGRMLDALKTLDARTSEAPAPPPAAPPLEASLAEAIELVDRAAESFGAADSFGPAETSGATGVLEAAELGESPDSAIPELPRAVERPIPPALPRRSVLPSAPFETCRLPIAAQPADCYLEMAGRICNQGAANYSNVLLLVAADRMVGASFSMVELAQSMALQLAGDVLLIDGELREGRLSRDVAGPGPGMVEAMLGQAPWTDIIHPTNVPQIDFVARGIGQVPTFERPQFGWGALRPLDRSVLIGLANQVEPETNWLAARCDAVYYVLSRRATRRSSASAAINALRASGANVAGSIVVDD